jgi:hypothetical protein
MTKKILNSFFLCLIVCFAACTLFISCVKNQDIRQKLLGKWKTDSFSWEITETGKVLYNDPTTKLTFDYSLVKSGNDDIMTLKMNEDSVKLKISFINDTTFKFSDTKNPNSVKIFKKIK